MGLVTTGIVQVSQPETFVALAVSFLLNKHWVRPFIKEGAPSSRCWRPPRTGRRSSTRPWSPRCQRQTRSCRAACSPPPVPRHLRVGKHTNTTVSCLYLCACARVCCNVQVSAGRSRTCTFTSHLSHDTHDTRHAISCSGRERGRERRERTARAAQGRVGLRRRRWRSDFGQWCDGHRR